tara:strand:+ start:227 stop:631 length:405 start_codon:yes stop_codon:yes gene_type:complete
MVDIKDILSKYKNIALIGASKDLTKTSTVVMKYLQDNGFKVYPVNPSLKDEQLLGEKVFEKISDIRSPVDIVDVFRPSNEAIKIAKETIEVGAKVFWLQLDIKSNEAKKIIEENNIIYIDDKCTKIEFEKYFKK